MKERFLNEEFKRGVEEVIIEDELTAVLNSGRQLRVKYGIDPTMPSPHIGHVVPMKKLRQFQEMGHMAVFIIGDYTARIGDPTGKNVTRPILNEQDIEKHVETYFSIVNRILKPDLIEIRRQSEWYSAFGLDNLFRLIAKVTHGQLMQHESFASREKTGGVLYMHEMIYPIIQAYDSVAVKADVELGGIDQKFNFMLTRDLQQKYGQKPEQVMLMRYLKGTDGKQKMSKSLGNTIDFTDNPNTMFGKIMSIPDSVLDNFYELATQIPLDELKEIMRTISIGEMNPMDAKKRLALEVVSAFHGENDATKSEIWFRETFQERKNPEEEIPVIDTDPRISIVDFLVNNRIVSSKTEARRLLKNGAIKQNQERVDDDFVNVSENDVIQVGKKRFVKLHIKKAL